MLRADVMRVGAPPGQEQQATLTTQLAAVQERYPTAEIGLIREGRGPADTTAFAVAREDGTTADVFVDPWNAEVLGSLNPDTTLSGYAIRLHGDLMTGRW